MVTISSFFIWAAYRTINDARSLFTIQFKSSKRNKADPYFFTYRTALLTYKGLEKVKADKVMSFMEKIQKSNSQESAKILIGYKIDNYKKIGNLLTSIDDSLVFYDHWLLSCYRNTLGCW